MGDVRPCRRSAGGEQHRLAELFPHAAARGRVAAPSRAPRRGSAYAVAHRRLSGNSIKLTREQLKRGTVSVCPQRDHWIDLRRSSRGQIAREQRDASQQKYHSGERERIRWGSAEEKRGNEARDCE